jgi:hypothetical protein
MTSDKDRTLSFYSELLGWSAEEPNEEFGGYLNFTKDGALVAGCMGSEPGSGHPEVWSIYLATDDARKTVDAAEAHGGQVMVPPMDVGELGTMAHVIDPSGAAIGVWQPGLHAGFGIVDEPNTPGWFELHTGNYDAAVRFYRDVFRWDTNVASDTPEFRYTTLGAGEDQLAGIMDASAFLGDAPSAWFVYFRVEDADAAVDKVVKLGGSVLEPAQDTPYGRLAAAADPNGARFRLVAGG